MKTYYAARNLEIQSHKIAKGDKVGMGEVNGNDNDTFTAVDELKGIIELGHARPRVADGRFIAEQPGADAPANCKKRGPKPRINTTSENAETTTPNDKDTDQ